MLTIDALKEYGADTESGLHRCMDNEALYLRLVGSVPAEPKFESLEEAINQGDKDKAFDAVHALKGVFGNLSLTPLFDKASEITELLREKADVDYAPLIGELKELRDELAKLIG
jgi:hypothetical protein